MYSFVPLHSRLLRRTLGAASLALLASAPAADAQARNTDSMLVSTAWLADHLNDPSVVVVQIASSRREYSSGHIPGARFLWTDTFAPSNPDLSTELAPLARLDSALEALGVSDKSRIILYGGETMTARMFLTLEYLGAGSRASILDGGLAAWKAENRSISTEVPVVKRASFTPRINASVITDADFVKSIIDKPGMRILDARAPNFYNGQGGGQPRPGHIPSALNVPFNSMLTEDGHFKDRATIEGLFKAAGVSSGDQVVTYCHVGQQASLLFFAARLAGFDARMYDGSFQDWSGRSELPLVGPTAK